MQRDPPFLVMVRIMISGMFSTQRQRFFIPFHRKGHLPAFFLVDQDEKDPPKNEEDRNGKQPLSGIPR